MAKTLNFVLWARAEVDDLRKALVNSDKLSDVLFTFPSDHGGQVRFIYGHKAILSSNCVVFARMFTGELADEKEKQVHIEDIKYDVFMELINFIYTGAFEMTTLNMIDLLYAAQKYLLIDFKTKTEVFILENLNNSNFLEIINASQCFENPEISAKCCYMFCNNPLYFMEKSEFLGLSVHSMKILLKQPGMNCTEHQLNEFALKWCNYRCGANEQEFTEAAYEKLQLLCTGVDRWQLGPKGLFNIETILNRGMLETFKFKSNMIYIENKQTIKLYGMGVYIGIFAEKETSQAVCDQPNYFQDTIHIRVWQEKKKTNYVQVYHSVQKIKQKNAFAIKQFLFEKLELTGEFIIQVEFGDKKMRSTICGPVVCDDLRFKIDRTRIEGVKSSLKRSCLAYILIQ